MVFRIVLTSFSSKKELVSSFLTVRWAEDRIFELACSPAPDGLSRWTIRLLEEKLRNGYGVAFTLEIYGKRYSLNFLKLVLAVIQKM